jgi:hypothetical protein
MLLIREVPVSNLSPKANYSDWGFLLLSSTPPGKRRVSALIWETFVSFHMLSNSLSIKNPVIRRYILSYWQRRQMKCK